MTRILRVAVLGLGLASIFVLPLGLQGKDKHPEITKAQKALFNAKSSLEHSARDVGGHRAKAVQAIDQALAELKLAAADK